MINIFCFLYKRLIGMHIHNKVHQNKNISYITLKVVSNRSLCVYGHSTQDIPKRLEVYKKFSSKESSFNNHQTYCECYQQYLREK